MSIISGLDGTVATLLICALLFIDEAGVPLPFAPNEVLLLVAGLLIGNGTIVPWIFLPLALLCLTGGMLTAYSWARAIGSDRLRALAARLRAERAYDRALDRLRTAGTPTILVTRLLPGVRIYATLIAGASEYPLRSFLIAALPALAIWTTLLVSLGFAVGLPAERLLNRFENLALTGILLVAAGAAAVLAIRRMPPRGAPESPIQGLQAAPPWERLLLALALDFGIVAAVVVGIDRLTRSALRTLRFNGPVEIAIVVAAVVVAYVTVSRRGAGTTAGEGLFDVSYRHPG